MLYHLLVKGERRWGGEDAGKKIVPINIGTDYRFKINDQAIEYTIMNFATKVLETIWPFEALKDPT